MTVETDLAAGRYEGGKENSQVASGREQRTQFRQRKGGCLEAGGQIILFFFPSLFLFS